jgi:hypothetical protein
MLAPAMKLFWRHSPRARDSGPFPYRRVSRAQLHGRIHIVTRGCSRTQEKGENQLLILIFHLICTPKSKASHPVL